MTGGGPTERPQALTRQFILTIPRAELERLRGEHRRDYTKLRRELTEAERGVARSLDLILSGDGAPSSVRAKLSGDGAPSSVRAKLQELEGNKARLEAEPAALSSLASAVVEIHPSVPEL